MPGKIPGPFPFWNESTRVDLLRCWIEAAKFAKIDTGLGLFEGFLLPAAYRY